jgi:hypothetical protein
MYRVEVKHTVNSDKFRPSAICFKQNGYYCPHPQGTTAYRKFWDEEITRCIKGYTAEDGEHITGYFYFYLNYCPILRVKEIEEEVNGKLFKRSIKPRDFPLFYDYDRAYFDTIEQAETEGKHLVVIKRRRAGYSFKGASMLCRNFYLIPDSKSFAIASDLAFLTGDGLLTKAWDFMDWIDANTAWGKKRQKVNTKTHKRASFIMKSGGVEMEVGYKSEIIGKSLNDDPQKIRGISGKLILWEEAGHFPNLKTSWGIARPSVEQGSIAHGLMICYGTGGTESADFEGLKELFYEPKAYNCLEIENTWDDALTERACGFFVPQFYNMDGYDENGTLFMDPDGNSNTITVKEYERKQRQVIIENASDRTTIDRYIAEHPWTPQEACLSISRNIFPKKDLISHLAYIRNHDKLRNYKQVGDLILDATGNLKWEPQAKPRDIIKYRLNKDSDKQGAIAVWEHPCEDPPYGLYIIGCDPYDHDQAVNTTSLGSCIVYKRFQTFEQYSELPVAEYTGRPDTVDEFYENVRKLALYYKATILYENEKKGLFTYFQHKHCEYLLADQPRDLIRDIMQVSHVERGKGLHKNKQVKGYSELRIRDWLNEEYEPGKKNLTKILSEPLLEELIEYDPDGNYDRVDAFGMVMLYREALFHIQIADRKKEFRRQELFPDGIFKDFLKDKNTNPFYEFIKSGESFAPWR